MGPTCVKYFLIALNVIILFTGGVLFISGILLKVDSGLLEPEVIDLLDNIKYNNVELGLLANAMAFIMMIVGVAIVVVGILGICGAWKKINACLMIYIVIIIMLLLGKAVLSGLWVTYRAQTGEWLKGKLQAQLLAYAGPTSTDTVSAGFNTLFMNAHCCGVTGQSTDFTSSTWKTTASTEQIPASCCQGVDSTTVASYVASSTCTTVPKNYYTDGCYYTIDDMIYRYFLVVIISSACLLVVEVMAIISACAVMDSSKNKVRHSGGNTAAAGKQPARPPPYVGIDSVLKNKKR